MSRRTLTSAIGLLVLVSVVLAGCAQATPTEAPPVATEAPAPAVTEAPPEIPFEPMASLTAPSCDYGGIVKEVKAIDRLTVEFDLCVPDPVFPQKVAFSVFAIFPSEWLASTVGAPERLEKPIGTGPYIVDQWVRGESITFKRFPDYWGEPGIADTIVFRWTSEAAARLLELQAGTVDGIDNPNPTDLEVIAADPTLQLMPRPGFNVFYMGMTNTFKPWDDVRVRQAVAMGIDRQRILDTFYPVGSEVATHFTPCSVPNGCVGEPWYDFDPVAAKALLADAGFADGFKTKLYYRDVVRSYLPQVNQVAEEIQSQLKTNLGIDAEIVKMESGTFLDESAAGNLDGIHLLGWNGDYPSVTNFLDYHFGQSQAQFGTPYPEIYENLVAGAQMADPAESEAIYTAANNAVRELVPMVPIAHGSSGVAYRADVTGAHASPLGNEYFAVTDPGGRDTFVWMQGGEPSSLFCADETDGEALRACEQALEALFSYEVGGTEVQPALAEGCEPNADATVYTCTLRDGVKFHDGTDFDANDVVATFTMGLDAASAMHVGSSSAFEYYATLWVALMNVPPQ